MIVNSKRRKTLRREAALDRLRSTGAWKRSRAFNHGTATREAWERRVTAEADVLVHRLGVVTN